ncbi:Na+/melibiose symporter-like transporter [Micromonospora pisi]|uniref:Na+/melibiose symporter-like transporter n=1 Tax=Micromonospora pisi TaxID=589240 RepID=A0A495JLJ6_9ACTN|nr:MFS transporter [Micromonospora pisi]RKR89847.1 Na+/melibiose symporter-like transporter [Micromonospora pisi]
MPLFNRPRGSFLGRALGTTIRGTRALLRGTFRGGAWITRGAGRARTRGAGGETGMVRLFDLHAVSCAGDVLITIGLAGTIFFNAPLGEARGKVALYLLVTMVPFALLAPVVGPLLDHFRHGRRYALAATMLGRAFLAWLISDYIHGFGLYPAAFGVLALSRAYGVARSAAVPRLLPEGIGLSQAGARASVYGTIAGTVVAPLGLAAFWLGPQWPLRVASVIFLVGMVIALRLPPRADSEPPEAVPRPIRAIWRGRQERALGRGSPGGRLVLAALAGGATLRGLYGFLLLFLAFAIKAGDVTTELLGRKLSDQAALGLVGGALAVGTFLATALGTRLRIHRPIALQSSGLVIVAALAVLATVRFSLLTVALLCLVTALVSGIAKLAVDASIQERIRERSRASAFAHSETALMLAFVAGGALGLIPFDGRVGIAVLSGLATLAAVRAVVVAGRLRGEKLHGRAIPDAEQEAADQQAAGEQQAAAERAAAEQAARDRVAEPATAETRTVTEPATASASASASAQNGNLAGSAPPGYHIYRPSSAAPGPGVGDDTRQPREPREPRT